MLSKKKKKIYQVMIFIELTIRFCAGNLLYIHYSYTLFPKFEPTSFRFEIRKKMGFEPASI